MAKNFGISVHTYKAWEKDISRIVVGKVIVAADPFGVEFSETKINQK